MAFPHTQARRCISFAADVLFLAGIVWLLLLTIAALMGGSHSRPAEHAGALMLGVLFVLPAPMLFFLDAMCRRGSPRHQPQESAPWPAARRSRAAPPVVPNASPASSPPSSPELNDPAFLLPQQWWEEDRPPTYEEAIRMPKLELVLEPSVHHPAPAAVYYQVP